MNIKKLLICTLLTLSLPVAAEFETVSRAYEIALSDFRVPATPRSIGTGHDINKNHLKLYF